MEKKFTSDEVPLGQLLRQAKSGELQLPDFQRGWVWNNVQIKSLLASISHSYPIGAVMTLKTGNPDVRFRPRTIEGAESASNVEPEVLLLDGQQRLTSLFLALMSKKPVKTKDSRGQEVHRHYYASINGCIDPSCEREEDGIFSVPKDRVVRKDFGRSIELDLRTMKREVAAEMFPLDIVLDRKAVFDWQMRYCHSIPNQISERVEKWKQFDEQIISPFWDYQVPTISLAKSTRKEAICQVFEKVNTGGVTLTVFELLTATYAADDFNLRDDWKARLKRFNTHAVLRGQRLNEGIKQTDFLQIVTLLSTYGRRLKHFETHGIDDKFAPAISANRRDILRLPLEEYRLWSDRATEGLERVVPFLRREHIFRYRDLPYATQLVPLAAIFGYLGQKAGSHSARERLRQWFWCGVFGEVYSGPTQSRYANDLQDCVSWIEDLENRSEPPRTVRDAQFQAERILMLRTRNSAAYKGLYALQMRRGCCDLRSGEPINVDSYFDDSIDIRHVFPKRWCQLLGFDKRIANCIVNKTAIDAQTARRIRGSAPSSYLRRLERNYHLDAVEMDAILHSHDIDATALRQDDFRTFFNRRFERLLCQIEQAMGKPVNRTAEKDESPFFSSEKDPQRIQQGVNTLIRQGESRVLEFKSTARRNLFTNKKDSSMEWAVVKTICAFMNSDGGTLLVGVDDEGRPLGIELDFPYVHSKNRDGWERWLLDLASNSMGTSAATDLRVWFCAIDGKTIARIDVSRATSPVFAKMSKSGKGEVFFARLGNATKELAGPDLLKYQKKRWPLL